MNILDSVIHKIFKSYHLLLASLKKDGRLKYTGPILDLLPISVAVPVVEKDLGLLEVNIFNLRKHCQNPIHKIYVISPDSEAVKNICQKLDLVWLDESTIAPVSKELILEAIKSPFMVNWFYQQFLKLNIDTVIENRYCLVIDADTILLKDQYFVAKDHMVLKTSDEYHFMYARTNKALLPTLKPIRKSFICHHQLIDCSILKELKDTVSGFGKFSFWNLILQSINGKGFFFSEYELYGTYVHTFHRNKVKVVYWNNKNLYKKNYSQDEIISLSQKYFSASFHNYNYTSFIQ